MTPSRGGGVSSSSAVPHRPCRAPSGGRGSRGPRFPWCSWRCRVWPFPCPPGQTWPQNSQGSRHSSPLPPSLRAAPPGTGIPAGRPPGAGSGAVCLGQGSALPAEHFPIALPKPSRQLREGAGWGGGGLGSTGSAAQAAARAGHGSAGTGEVPAGGCRAEGHRAPALGAASRAPTSARGPCAAG